MDQVQIFQTSKGKDAIYFDGYCYRFARNTNARDVFWRCLTKNCTARMKTNVEFGNPTIRGNGHRHLSNPEEFLIRSTLNTMKR